MTLCGRSHPGGLRPIFLSDHCMDDIKELKSKCLGSRSIIWLSGFGPKTVGTRRQTVYISKLVPVRC
jgi:hypothetical protein